MKTRYLLPRESVSNEFGTMTAPGKRSAFFAYGLFLSDFPFSILTSAGKPPHLGKPPKAGSKATSGKSKQIPQNLIDAQTLGFGLVILDHPVPQCRQSHGPHILLVGSELPVQSRMAFCPDNQVL